MPKNATILSNGDIIYTAVEADILKFYKYVEKGLDKFNKTIDSAKGFVMLVTEENNFKNQILAGCDLYQLCLALTKNGLYMHPLNQANEEFKEMEVLSSNFDKLVGISGDQKIQIIARIGQANKPYKSYRKHLKDLIL